MAEPARLPTDIEEAIAACERQIDEDSDRIQESIDSIDGIPDEVFDAPSVVRAVDDVRTSLRRTAARVRESISPVVK